MQSTRTPNYCTHPSKSNNCNIYIPTTTIYVPVTNMPLKCHTYKPHAQTAHYTSIRGMYVNIYATSEPTGINHVTRSAVYRQCWTTMMMQPDYIS